MPYRERVKTWSCKTNLKPSFVQIQWQKSLEVLSSRPEDVDGELQGDVEDDGIDFALPLSPVSAQLVDVSAAGGVTHIQIIVKLQSFSSTQTHTKHTQHCSFTFTPQPEAELLTHGLSPAACVYVMDDSVY